MKEIQHFSSPSYRQYGAFHASSKNYDIIRYDDVLLMKNEYVPIPEQEIVLSEGLYQQNPGY